MSFFLWSSVPDDELIDLAAREELGRPDVLEAQVTRMLADPRSRSLVENFAHQWLYLRNLTTTAPSPAVAEFRGVSAEGFDKWESLRKPFRGFPRMGEEPCRIIRLDVPI